MPGWYNKSASEHKLEKAKPLVSKPTVVRCLDKVQGRSLTPIASDSAQVHGGVEVESVRITTNYHVFANYYPNPCSCGSSADSAHEKSHMVSIPLDLVSRAR